MQAEAPQSTPSYTLVPTDEELDDHFKALKKDFFEKSNRFVSQKERLESAPKTVDEIDIVLLQRAKDRMYWYPFRYTMPTIAFIYLLTHHVHLSFLKNPLREVTPFRVKVSSRVKMVYFVTMSAVSTPLLHGYFVTQYLQTKFYLYKKYQFMTDSYVLDRDQGILQNLIKGKLPK